MFCERCGAKLENGMMYCQNCGAPVKSQNSGKPYGDLDKTVAYHEEEEKTVAYHEQDEDKTVAYYETAYQQPRYGKESRSREDFTEQNYDSQWYNHQSYGESEPYRESYRGESGYSGGNSPKKNNKPWLYVVLGVVVTLLVVFIAFELKALLSLNSEEEETVAESQQADEQKDTDEDTVESEFTPQATPTPMPTPVPAATPVPATAPAMSSTGGYLGNDYIFPDSAVRELTEADFADKTEWELKVARNEIYARHGRMFDTPGLDSHFRSKSWYVPSIPGSQFNDTALLNSTEQKNAKKILDYELAHGMET